MPTLASGLRISSQRLGPDETIPQTHRGPYGPSMIRSVKRAIVGHSWGPSHIRLLFVHDVPWGTSRRDGFARDCPHRHPVARVLALRDHLQLTSVFLGVLGRLHCPRQDCQGAETRPGRGGSRRQPSVSRAGFHGPGWALRESRYPPADGGRRIGPPRGPMSSPSASGVAPAGVGIPLIPGYPGFQNS